MAVTARTRAMFDELLATRHVPLFRSSAALTVNTGVNALLGFAYWVAAARLYPEVAVGSGAAAISALQLGAGIGWTGFQYTLMRYLPQAGRLSRLLVLGSYASGMLIALPAGLAIIAYAGLSGQMSVIADGVPAALLFLLGIAGWVVFSLEDAALIGLRRSAWVPLENGAYGLLKLVILVALASTASALGLLLSWALGALCLIVVVNALLFVRVLQAPRAPGDLPAVPELARFTLGHHAAALVALLPDWIAPLLVIDLVSRQANAYYYAAWTVAFSLRLVFVNIANALIVEGARRERSFAGLLRLAFLLGGVVLVPIIVVTLVAARPILSVFGHHYAAGAGVLELFAIGLVPFSLLNLFVARERVIERVIPAFAAMSVSTIVTIAADVALLPRIGIEGAGVGWGIGQVAGLVIAGVSLAFAVPRGRRRAAVRDATGRPRQFPAPLHREPRAPAVGLANDALHRDRQEARDVAGVSGGRPE